MTDAALAAFSPRFQQMYQYLQSSADLVSEATGLGFIEASADAYGVGLPDDGKHVRDQFFLFSTAWRRTSVVKHVLPPELWLLQIGTGGVLFGVQRSWMLPDAVRP